MKTKTRAISLFILGSLVVAALYVTFNRKKQQVTNLNWQPFMPPVGDASIEFPGEPIETEVSPKERREWSLKGEQSSYNLKVAAFSEDETSRGVPDNVFWATRELYLDSKLAYQVVRDRVKAGDSYFEIKEDSSYLFFRTAIYAKGRFIYYLQFSGEPTQENDANCRRFFDSVRIAP